MIVGAEFRLVHTAQVMEFRHNTSTLIKSQLYKSLSRHSQWFMPFEIYKLGKQKTNLYRRGLGCFHRSKRRISSVWRRRCVSCHGCGYCVQWRQRLGMKQMIQVVELVEDVCSSRDSTNQNALFVEWFSRLERAVFRVVYRVKFSLYSKLG